MNSLLLFQVAIIIILSGKIIFGKTNDTISLAIDTAKVGLSSAEIFYLAKEVKPDVLTKANFAVSFWASMNDVLQINDKLEKGEKITDKLILNTASDFSVPQGSQPIKANKNLENSRIPRDCFGRFAPSQ